MTSRTAGSPGMADAVLLADVGNTRIKLAAVLEPAVLELPGPRRLPVIGRRQDLVSRCCRTGCRRVAVSSAITASSRAAAA